MKAMQNLHSLRRFAGSLTLLALLLLMPLAANAGGNDYQITRASTSQTYNWSDAPTINLADGDVMTILSTATADAGGARILIGTNANVTINGNGNMISNLYIEGNASETTPHNIAISNLKFTALSGEAACYAYKGVLVLDGTNEIVGNGGAAALGAYGAVAINSTSGGTLQVSGYSGNPCISSSTLLDIQGNAQVTATGNNYAGVQAPAIAIAAGATLNVVCSAQAAIAWGSPLSIINYGKLTVTSGGSAGTIYTWTYPLTLTMSVGAITTLNNNGTAADVHSYTMAAGTPAGSAWALSGNATKTNATDALTASPLSITVAAGTTGTITLAPASVQTYDDLLAAMQGELNGAANFTAFAAKAQDDLYPMIARLFQATADAKAKHAEDIWTILQSMGATDAEKPAVSWTATVGTTAENLQASIDGTYYEYTTMYPGFQTTSQAEGLTDAAHLFDMIGKSEQNHWANFSDAKAHIGDWTYLYTNYSTLYRCPTCGEVVKARPATCPICATSGSAFILYSQTYDDLLAAMQGEINGAASFTAFAAQAKAESYPMIARLFQATADAKAKHAEDIWAMLQSMGATDAEKPAVSWTPTVGTTAENLQVAVDGTTYEWTTMYPGFKTTAQNGGLTDAANLFDMIGKAEQNHAGNFSDALAHVNDWTYLYTNYSTLYRCPTCGEVVNTRPATCPICATSGSAFILYSQTYDDLLAAMQGEINAVANFTAFAAKAQAAGYPMIARLFQATADAKAKHAQDIWAMLQSMGATDAEKPVVSITPTAGTTAQNLQMAVDGTTYEYTTMYPGFKTTAQNGGLTDAANLFNMIGQAEQNHQANFSDALAHLGDLTYLDTNYSTLYRCPTCGEVVKVCPATCPICGTSGSAFILYSATYTISASTLTPFGSLQIPYTQPAAQTVTVTNTGTGAITLTQPTAANYVIGTLSATNLAAGATATFTVRPKAGLAAGTYNETINISGSNSVAATVSASFTVTSAPVTVNAATPNITYQPQDETVEVGDAVTLSVTATVSDGGALTYRWYDAATGRPISDATGRTYSPPTATAGTYSYYVVVTNTNNSVNGSKIATATSNTVTVTVNPPAYAATPTISVQLKDSTVNRGASLTLSVTATVTDGGALTYQWYDAVTGKPISGATGSSYSPPTTTAGTYSYYVVITNTNSSATVSKTSTVKSRTVTITVNSPVGIENVSASSSLKAWAANGTLHVSGLTAGKTWSVYNISGYLIYQGIAGSDTETLYIASHGVYIVQSGNKTVKVMN